MAVFNLTAYVNLKLKYQHVSMCDWPLSILCNSYLETLGIFQLVFK